MRRKTLLQSNNVSSKVNATNLTNITALTNSNSNSYDDGSSEGVDYVGSHHVLEAEKTAKYQRDVAEIVENCQRKFSKDFNKPKKKAKKLHQTDR